jgi:hypothetical protein
MFHRRADGGKTWTPVTVEPGRAFDESTPAHKRTSFPGDVFARAV